MVTTILEGVSFWLLLYPGKKIGHEDEARLVESRVKVVVVVRLLELFSLLEILRNHLPRFPLPLPLPLPPPLVDELLLGPSISWISFLLNFNVPPENLPTAGAPTPLSLFPSLLFLPFILALSRMMPFSFASRLRLSSRSVSFATIPFRCVMGIFSCLNREVFDPSACNRRSVALCLFFPLSVGLLLDSRRWDSVRRRWRARSFFRLADSEASSSLIKVPSLSRIRGMDRLLLGGFDPCRLN